MQYICTICFLHAYFGVTTWDWITYEVACPWKNSLFHSCQPLIAYKCSPRYGAVIFPTSMLACRHCLGYHTGEILWMQVSQEMSSGIYSLSISFLILKCRGHVAYLSINEGRTAKIVRVVVCALPLKHHP